MRDKTNDVLDYFNENFSHIDVYVECRAVCDHVGARDEEISSVKCGDRFYLLETRHDGFWRVMLAYNDKEHKGP